MIWFACKQCGKRHGRAESLVGTLVFCECGQGNRVPWSSTAPEPDPRQAEPVPRPRAPEPPPEARRGPDLPPPRRRERPVRRVRASYCFNHDEDASTDTCAECKLPFCKGCVVTLRG